MKTKIVMSLSIALTMALSINCTAQPGPPPPAGPHPVPGLMAPPSPGAGLMAPPPGIMRGPGEGLQQIKAFAGKTGEWVSNDDFVYDGFYLQTDSGKMLVKFPPAMGTRFRSAAKTGNSVAVNGVTDISPEGIRTIRLTSLVFNGKTISDTGMAAPSLPATGETITGSGKITSLLKNKMGETNGFLVDEKTILRLPPHVARQLGTAMSSGASVSYTGVGKPANTGEVASANYRIVHCQTLKLNGVEYLLR